MSLGRPSQYLRLKWFPFDDWSTSFSFETHNRLNFNSFKQSIIEINCFFQLFKLITALKSLHSFSIAYANDFLFQCTRDAHFNCDTLKRPSNRDNRHKDNFIASKHFQNVQLVENELDFFFIYDGNYRSVIAVIKPVHSVSFIYQTN